jgi:hypothetical protein
MALSNNYTYKVPHSISTISRTDRCSVNSKAYAAEEGKPYRSNEQVGMFFGQVTTKQRV